MSGLNLNSLKNLWSLPTSPHAPSDTPVHTASTSVPVMKPIDIASTAPAKKLSLMSLKKSPASMEEKASAPEPVIVKTAPLSEPEKQIAIAEAMLPTVEGKPLVITEEKMTIQEEPLKIEASESIFIPDNEAVSISIGWDDISQTEISPVTMKEFFPNLQSLGNIPLHENTDIISESIPTEVMAPVKENVAVVPEAVATENSTVAEAPASEYMVIENSPESTLIEALESTDEEYVAEVKTELSEQRRAGFRFLMGKKAKIIAGVGIIASLSVIALLSNPFISNTATNGKSNIQEVVPPAAIPVDGSAINPVITETPPAEVLPGKEPAPTPVVVPSSTTTGSGEAVTSEDPVVTAGYEAGRDYTVTKNTKKNTRSTPISPLE